MPIYLRLDDIKGNVTAQGYEGQIEIGSFAHGVSVPVTTRTDGVESGMPSIAEISMMKATDAASVPLLRAALTATVAPTGQVSFVKTDEGQAVTYLMVDLENVHISSFATSSGGDRPTEQLSLLCERITWTYVDERDKVAFSYDVVGGKAV